MVERVAFMKSWPVPFEPERWWVASATRQDVVHLVDVNYEGGPACSCHDCQCRERECKHIRHLREKGVIKK